MKTTDVHPQTVLQGQTVLSRQTAAPEVVRSVSVVLHLANGTDEVYDEGDRVQVVKAERVVFPKELTDPPAQAEE